ncbi:MAG: SH3 domain-containing protein [Clostridiales bacterium]|nr:SH3 domain-containing protein [Clostridiales bacterium]
MSLAFSALSPSEEARAEERFTIDGVNLRKGPSTSDDVIKVLKYGTSVELLNAEEGEGGDWSFVSQDGDEGYIKREYLAVEQPPERAVPARSAVELLSWSEVKPIFTIGVAAKIYDVWSGLVYYVKSFSNGSHADVEPVTKDDTAIMKRTYGNVWDWDGRPVWVTINGRTIAAAINGMPHGGGVNSSNGMNGQVCLHFYGSAVHNGNKTYQRQLQEVVMQSWNAAN